MPEVQRKYDKTLSKMIFVYFMMLTSMFQLAILPKIAPMLLIVALAPAAIAGMSKYHNRSPGIVAGSNINADPKTTSPAIVTSLVTSLLLPVETAKRVSAMHALKTFLFFGRYAL